MKLNKELRTKRMIINLRYKWLVTYLILFGLIVFAGVILYQNLGEDQLPPGYISISVDKDKYQVGESIEFTVNNHFPTPIYMTNNCPSEPFNIYRWNKNNWVQIHDVTPDQDSSCYKQPRRIKVDAEQSLVHDFNDWPDLFDEPGVYRIVMEVEHYDELPYQDFVVLEPAEIEVVPAEVQAEPVAPAVQAPRYNDDEDDGHEDEHEEDDD